MSARAEDAAARNQRRMNANPLEVMLLNMGYGSAERSASDEAADDQLELNCRPS